MITVLAIELGLIGSALVLIVILISMVLRKLSALNYTWSIFWNKLSGKWVKRTDNYYNRTWDREDKIFTELNEIKTHLKKEPVNQFGYTATEMQQMSNTGGHKRIKYVNRTLK